MLKIFHLADIHIHNLKFHQEYKEVFNKFYILLEQQKPDVVVICGDLADKKTQLSPEYFDLCSSFLSNIAKRSKVIVIPGNHDGIISNTDRLDAITPVVHALNHENITYLKRSCEHTFNDSVVFNHLSIFDRENWKTPSDLSKINIALYHGSISGCKLDNGWVLEKGDDELSVFNKFDYVFLGDIHLTNQALDNKGRIRYPGSMIQQNFGETNNKGFLCWEIEDKDIFKVSHIPITRPKPFITFHFDKDIETNIEVPIGSRVRVITSKDLSFASSKEIIDLIKSQFDVESVSVIDGRHISQQTNKNFEFKNDTILQNKQQSLFYEFLKANKTSEAKINAILTLDKEITLQLNEYRHKEDVVQFEILDLEWNNFFQFGLNNYINFQDKLGIIGVFGENQTGKSSIIDTLIYTIYGDVSKKIKKNVQVINHSEDFCDGKVRIRANNNIFIISRRTQKVKKKLKGEEIIDAQVQVDFSVFDPLTNETTSLNGEGTQETNKNIRSIFGDIDHLLLTSISSQFGSFQFIDERSTNRKELLGKLLKLDVFGKKYDLANKKTKELKTLLKKYDNTDFDHLIKQHRASLQIKELAISNLDIEKQQLDVHISKLNEEKNILRFQITDITSSSFQFGSTNIQKLESDKVNLVHKIDEITKKISVYQMNLEKLQEKHQLLPNKKEVEKVFKEVFTKKTSFEKEKKILENELQTLSKKVQLLKEVPCGDSFPTCKFIKDAFEASAKIGKKTYELQEIKEKYSFYVCEEEKNNKVLREINEVDTELAKAQEKLNENNKLLVDLQQKLKKVQDDINVFYSHKEEYEKIKLLQEKNNKITLEISKIDQELRQTSVQKDNFNREVISFSKDIGSLEEKIQTLLKEQEVFEKLKNEFELYEKYLECVHPSGISYTIIKQTLPLINKEINSILSNIINFSVELADEDDRLEVYVKKPDHKPTLIEGCSGAERTIASLGIRLALLFISSIPRSDKFILDEPALWLDKHNFDGFLNLLELIKVYFKNVILITHLDALKEVADVILNVSIDGSYSKVS